MTICLNTRDKKYVYYKAYDKPLSGHFTDTFHTAWAVHEIDEKDGPGDGTKAT